MQDGLYSCKNLNGYCPSTLVVEKYVLPNTFGNTDLEEAVARIISFSIEEGKWLGVSWTKIENMISLEIKKRETTKATRIENLERNKCECYSRIIKGILSLGIYTYFTKPIIYEVVISKEENYQSVIPKHGIRAIFKAIEKLVSEEYIDKSMIAGEVVFFPTEKTAKNLKKFIPSK